jgi:hypothetical protein
VEGKGYKSLINLPVWKSALPFCPIDKNLSSPQRKNTLNTVVSKNDIPIRDIAVKHAIEE